MEQIPEWNNALDQIPDISRMPQEPDGFSAIEIISYMQGETEDHWPKGVSRYLCGYLQHLNADMNCEERRQLLPLLPNIAGTPPSYEVKTDDFILLLTIKKLIAPTLPREAYKAEMASAKNLHEARYMCDKAVEDDPNGGPTKYAKSSFFSYSRIGDTLKATGSASYLLERHGILTQKEIIGIRLDILKQAIALGPSTTPGWTKEKIQELIGSMMALRGSIPTPKEPS